MSYRPATFAQFEQQQAPEPLVIVHVRAHELVTTWTKTGGRSIVYQAPVVQYDTVLNVRRVDRVSVSDPSTLVETQIYIGPSDTPTMNTVEVTSLTQRATVALVDSNPGSFFHDLAAGVLYVSMIDGSAPAAKVIYCGFLLKFGPGRSADGSDYKDGDGDVAFPYLEGVPQITKSVGSAFFGVIQGGTGTLALISASGNLDEFVERYVWEQGEVTAYLGAPSLPWSEFQEYPLGRVQSTDWTETRFSLSLMDAANDLSIKFPREVFSAADATKKLLFYRGGVVGSAFATKAPVSIEPTAATTRLAIGQPKPLGYGRNENVTPVCVAISATAGMWRLTRHPNYAIESVTVGDETVGEGGAGTTFDWYATLDLSSICIFAKTGSLASASPLVTFSGKMKASGELMTNPADIVRDIVSVEAGLATPFDTDVLDRSRFLCNLYTAQDYIATESVLSAVLDRYMQSTLSFFYLSNDGEFRFETWAPSVASEVTLDEGFGDFIDIGRSSDGVRLYPTVFVEYALNPSRGSVGGGVATGAVQPGAGTKAASTRGNYLRTSSTRAEGAALILDRTVPFTVQGTVLADESSAFILASRYAKLSQASAKKWRITSRQRAARLDLFSAVGLVKERKPTIAGRTPHLMVTKITRDLAQLLFSMELVDQYVIGAQSFIAPTGGVAWSTLTTDERRSIGCFTDNAGYPDATAPESWGTDRLW